MLRNAASYSPEGNDCGDIVNLSIYRLKYGLHWKRKYPNPFTDYRKETRLALLSIITVLSLYATASSWEYHDLLNQEREVSASKDGYVDFVKDCAAEKKVALVWNDRLIAVECVDYGVATAGIRRM